MSFRQEDDEHVQLVLNDFLEAKFELLADILRSCYYGNLLLVQYIVSLDGFYLTFTYYELYSDFVNSSKLTTILEECFGRLFRDLCNNPTLMDTNYISELKAIRLEG